VQWTSRLFQLEGQPDREDVAFLDRLHLYLREREMPTIRMEFLTNHYGFVEDYLPEACRSPERRVAGPAPTQLY
jgi:predicted ATP-dependent Lon-type protease